MKTFCDICPFSNTPRAIAEWGGQGRNMAMDCARSLLEDFGPLPHACFKVTNALTPATSEPVCYGHEQWIKNNHKEENDE